MLGTRTRRPRGSDAPSGPDPLGENITFSSPPLKPRGLLLSVMRQKVGKERSQEGFAPLANPRFFQTVPRRMFGLAPTPLRLCKTPVGVPSGTAKDDDAKHRDWFSPKLRPHAFLRALPSRRDGRAGRLPFGRPALRLLLPASTPSDPSRATARNLAIPSCGPDARRKRHEPRRGAEPAVGRRLARATLRVAVVQLDARLQTINRESSALRLPPEALRAWALRPRDAKHRERLGKILSPKLGQDLPMTGRSFVPRRPAVSR